MVGALIWSRVFFGSFSALLDYDCSQIICFLLMILSFNVYNSTLKSSRKFNKLNLNLLIMENVFTDMFNCLRAMILAIVFILMTGCSSGVYKDAHGPNTAKLRLVMKEPIVSNLMLSHVDVDSCTSKGLFLWVSGGTSSLYEKKVGMLDTKPPKEGILEYVIESDKPISARPIMHFAKLDAAEILFYNTFSDSISSKQPGICPSPILQPKAGAEYEIEYEVAPGGCEVKIYKLEKHDSVISRVDITDSSEYLAQPYKDGELNCEKSAHP